MLFLENMLKTVGAHLGHEQVDFEGNGRATVALREKRKRQRFFFSNGTAPFRPTRHFVTPNRWERLSLSVTSKYVASGNAAIFRHRQAQKCFSYTICGTLGLGIQFALLANVCCPLEP